jgi:hypothetical protein
MPRERNHEMDVPQRARKLVDDLAGEGFSPEEVTDVIAAAFVDALAAVPNHLRGRAIEVFMAMLDLVLDTSDETHEA